jgi:hypothetical protein
MKRKWLAEEQIAFALRQHDSLTPNINAASRVPLPASHSASTFPRRSFE